MDALVVEELPEVDHRRLVRREEALQARGVVLVGQTLRRVARVRRIGTCLGHELRQRLVTRFGPELFHVDPRRNLAHAVDVANHLREHLADVARSDIHHLRRLEAPAPPFAQLGVPSHRVLELRAVGLYRIARA